MIVQKGGYFRFRDGEVLAFERFFKENFSKFYAFAGKFLGENFEGEDIVQEAFIQVWAAGKNVYESELALHAFMYRVVRNKCLDYIKHKRIMQRFSVEHIHACETEEYLLQSIIDEEYRFLLHKAICTLSPQCQIVMKLHLEGKKNQEIAEEMGITLATVKFHKTVAYRQLSGMLGHILLLLSFSGANFFKKNEF